MSARSTFRCACVALLCALAGAPAAHAADVLELGADGRARAVQDPYVSSRPDLPERAAGRRAASRPRAAAAGAPAPTVPGELRRLLDTGAIDQATYDGRQESYDHALEVEGKLTGARRVELSSVRRTLDAIAARGQLTVSRLPSLWLTLERNVRWWTTGPLLSPGRRVGFAGSELVWQYYPGQGLQIQWLGTFGKLNALWRAKADDKLERLLDEALALPAERAGGLAWEYLFTFDGGAPPWVSGLAQGTGLQSIARAAIRLDRTDEVIPIAQRGLGIFETPPPEGVRVPDGDGAHYLIYSFAPGLRVLNGFAQAVIGLHDFAGYASDPRAQALYEAGERVAERETPRYDTGAWSLYSRGSSSRESDLSYHNLLREFLAGLCTRTGADAFCTARRHFSEYLVERPVVSVTTTRVRGGTTARLRFGLSKIGRVGVTVSRGGRRVLTRPAFPIGRGAHFVVWTVPRKAGSYEVSVTAVDLAGNVGSTAATVEVLKPKPKPKRKTRRTPKRP